MKAKQKRLSREAMCRKIYKRNEWLYGDEWRTRRDGKQYKAYWLTKHETKKLYRAKALNRACFYKTMMGHIAGEWQGAIKQDGLLMIVRVAITDNGASRITFTKEN